MRIVTLTLGFVAAAAAAQAQERPLARAGLPAGVEARLTAIIENPATRQIHGEATIAAQHAGDVVVYKGPLTLSARINGTLVVIDGNVQLEPGAAVTGDVIVVNGEALGIEGASIDGTVMLFADEFQNGELQPSARRRPRYRRHEHRDWGHSSFTVGTSWNYNRVEGLPVQFGPVIETGGRNPTRLEALAIWRTEVSGPFETEDWGYKVQAEQFLGGQRDFSLGARLRSVIEPIEDWQLTRSEASLATLVLHSDYRDYFEREGWSVYARYAPRGSKVSASLGYSDEDHTVQPARDPWTIFENGEPWRLQPLVAEGRFRSLDASVQLDRRQDKDFASTGWFVRGDLTRGLGGSLRLPLINSPFTTTEAVAIDEQFTHGLLDARVYRRIDDDATLSFRLVGGGALGTKALPPQFQHALGGAGALPGYSLFSADCGARTVSGTLANGEATSYFPYYGCDRMAMFSAEYRGGFDFHFDGFSWDEDDDSGWHIDSDPNWIVFFDAARGWAHDDSKQRGARDTGTLYDLGAGIVLGDFGIYGAVPLTGSNRSMKFFVRLGPRF